MALELLGKCVARKTKTTSPTLGALTTKKKNTFLAALAKNGVVSYACEAADTTNVTAYSHRKKDPVFAAAWAEALEGAIQRLEQEAFRRAVDGVEEPVFHKGVICGRIKKYSDTLLIFLMKANRPEKYRDRFDVNISGTVKHKHQLDLSTLKEGDLQLLEKLMGKARIIDSTAERVA